MDGFLVVGSAAPTGERDAVLKAGLDAEGWRRARSTPSACLFVLDDTPVRDVGAAWAIGELFVRGTGRPAPKSLADWSGEDGFEGICARFVREFWGRYVLVSADVGAVLRDPSGHMDCLVWKCALGWGAGSQLPRSLPAIAQPTNFAIDWKALATVLNGTTAPGMALGLEGLAPVLPGGLSRIGSGQADRLVWNPSWFAARPHGSYAASAEAVAAAVEESLTGELAANDTILAEISGGLDSAIMSTTLAKLGGGARTRFVNLHAADPASDERPFARAVAQAAGVDLVELEKPELTLDEALLAALPISERPSVNGFDHHYDAGMAAQAATIGAKRILTGQGGDIVFFQTPSPAVIAELWGPWLRRPRADPAWRQLEDAARWNRRSVWSLLGEAARSGWWWPGGAGDQGGHPWLAEPLAPAKRRQVLSLARSQLFHGASLRGRQAQLIHPLLHQPIQEAVLAAPVIDLARHGIGRSLARDVFARQLPEKVRGRRSKGDLTAYYGRMMLRSLPAVRPHLLDGRLVGEGLLDRGALEAHLDPDRLIYEGDYPRLFEIIALEAFVRHWEGRLASAAAGAAPRRSASQGSTIP